MRWASAVAAKFWIFVGFRGAVILLLSVPVALACGWSYVTDHSVRFNSYRSGRQFYRLPPLPVMYDPRSGKELSVRDANPEADQWPEPDYVEPVSKKTIYDRAIDAIKNDDLRQAKSSFEEYLGQTEHFTPDDDKDRQKLRNSAIDMLDALGALRSGSPATAVREYLDARMSFDNDDEGTGAFLEHAHTDVNLRDNWEYLKAADLYRSGAANDALNSFGKFIHEFPRSEKANAAFYMLGRIPLEHSYAFDHTDCWPDQKDAENENAGKCKDNNWRSAESAFKSLIARYPNGRYKYDARGWLAFLNTRGGNYALGLAEYYRLLGDPTNLDARLAAKRSLQLLGHELDDSTLDKVETLIAGDVDTSMAYSYHRIYNYATDRTYEERYGWFSADDSQERADDMKRVDHEHESGDHELSRIARFASAMMTRYPSAHISSGFVLRIAEAEIELKDYVDAAKHAERALSIGLSGNLRAEALWIKGSCEHALHNLRAARQTFVTMIGEFPKNKLTEGARRLLALTAEDEGDLESALEQYIELGYDYDVAYYIDVLMPTDRLAKFVANHKTSPKYDEMLYALGLKFMRDKRWNDARTAMLQVHTSLLSRPTADYENDRSYFAKQPRYDADEPPGIQAEWIMQDLKTIEVLEHLENRIELARDDEAKAEAMYQYASFQFDANALLFYDPAAWKGQRTDLLSQLVSDNKMRFANEPELIFEYSKTHDTYARSIPLYEEVVEKYPNTKAAKDALYTAAVAQGRLANQSDYWRDIYAKGLFVGIRHEKLTDVGRMFPKFRWPIGQVGWQASTRTVNGGPAYAPWPQPAPKLTFSQRVERKASRYGGKVGTVIQKLYEPLWSAAVLFIRVNMLLLLLAFALYTIRKNQWLT